MRVEPVGAKLIAPYLQNFTNFDNFLGGKMKTKLFFKQEQNYFVNENEVIV